MIGIINYDSGNLRSVGKAFERAGAAVRLIGSPAEINDLHALVLPGVGAFGDSVRALKARGLWEPVGDWLREGRPFFGICLGYQLLFDSSEESPDVPGFGVVPGRVVHFKRNAGRKIPQIGWNTIAPVDRMDPLWEGLSVEPFVFFVHSYYPLPDDDSVVASRCDYDGERFAASVRFGNAVATQFHPEKSQTNGLRIIQNFLKSL